MYKGRILKLSLVSAIITGALLMIVPIAVNAMGKEQVVSEQEYKNISDELGDLELKYGGFDYQREVESRLNTLEASLGDIKKEIERNTNSEIKSDLEYRYKELTPIYRKYSRIVRDTKDESAYEEIAFSLNDDLEAVYEKINN